MDFQRMRASIIGGSWHRATYLNSEKTEGRLKAGKESAAKSGFRQTREAVALQPCTAQILGKPKQTQTAMQVGAAPLWPSKETCPRTC